VSRHIGIVNPGAPVAFLIPDFALVGETSKAFHVVADCVGCPGYWLPVVGGLIWWGYVTRYVTRYVLVVTLSLELVQVDTQVLGIASH